MWSAERRARIEETIYNPALKAAIENTHLDALSTWVSGQLEPAEMQEGEAVGGAGPDAKWHKAAQKIEDSPLMTL